MNRHEFIDELKNRLRRLPYDEVKEAVEYYEAYFDDAGEENEQAVLAELGSPSAVAAQIIAEFAIKGSDTEESVKKKWGSTWHVVLAIFTAPVTVPVALSVGAVALALIITMSAVLFSFFATGIGLLAAGAACAILSIIISFQSFSTTLLLLGCGLLLAGIGGAIVVPTTTLSKKCFGWLTTRVSNFILRGKK